MIHLMLHYIITFMAIKVMQFCIFCNESKFAFNPYESGNLALKISVNVLDPFANEELHKSQSFKIGSGKTKTADQRPNSAGLICQN